MKNKLNDRIGDVGEMKHNISNAIENIHLAEKADKKTDDEKVKRNLEAKNEKREEAIDVMRTEIKEESADKRTIEG